MPSKQGLRHLQTAFTNFLANRGNYPNFKKKRHGGSAEFTKSAFKWKDGKVFLAKCVEPLLIRENQTIAVESLAVKTMVKNPKLSRASSDAGWGEMVRQLEYKAKWYGRTRRRYEYQYQGTPSVMPGHHLSPALQMIQIPT